MNVSRRLNAYAKEQGLDINKIRITFALERLVARIETDKKLSESLVYKGGFVLLKTTSTNRYTVDIDALAQRISEDEAKKRILAAVASNLDDGIAFGDAKLANLEVESEDYGGIRISVRFQLDTSVMGTDKMSRMPLVHFDVAFGEYLPAEPAKAK